MRHFYVTLSASGTAYSLKALIKAISPTFIDEASEVRIQSAKANTGDVFLGDAGVTTTNYGFALLNAGEWIAVGTSIDGLYAVPDANTQILAISYI